MQYRIKGASTWQTAGNYETAATKIYNIRMTDSIYEVRIALQDGIQTSYAGATLDIGTILYEYDPTGNELKFKVPVAFASGPDYVVDSGTSGSWRYQKWASGIVELWGAHQVKASSSTAIGNGYYSSQFSIALPFGMTGAVVSGTAAIFAISATPMWKGRLWYSDYPIIAGYPQQHSTRQDCILKGCWHEPYCN